MRIVVIGASGNVGTGLLRRLSSEQQVSSILGLARRLPAWTPDKTEWRSVDIAHDELTPHLRDADVVVHLGWLFQPTHDPITTWRNNVLGGIRVFRAVADADVPALVYASSVGAYSPGPPGGTPVDEQWPTHGWPTAGYSREKSYLERVLDAFELAEPDRRVVRMRPGFIFQREASLAQRRLFAGPFVPRSLMRPELIPVLPHIPGLRFQALHADDVAEAYCSAIRQPVHGAFNLAADPVIDMPTLAGLLNARLLRTPAGAARTALACAWHLRLLPASPQLFELALKLPVMDVSRARTELGWTPRHSGTEAVSEFFAGLRTARGLPTPPLDPATSGPMQTAELATGIGGQP
jgi:nucleoside-diphosphate-sugar epimerase